MEPGKEKKISDATENRYKSSEISKASKMLNKVVVCLVVHAPRAEHKP
jgi:hypothetical protein